MPFVQRVVTPIYISRTKQQRHYQAPAPTSITTTPTAPASASASTPTTAIPIGSVGGSSTSTSNVAGTAEPASQWPQASATNGHIDDIDAMPLPSPPPSPPLPPWPDATNGGDPVAVLPTSTLQPTTFASNTVSVVTTTSAASAATANERRLRLERRCASDESEFDAVTNRTLSNALRQLASLMLIANDIFEELHAELQSFGGRTVQLAVRVGRLVERVDAFDPKLVAVRE